MTRNEKIVEESKQLMNEPENIRNIAIAAHVDHGKSVHKNTKIQMANGELIEAQKLHEIFRSEGGEYNEYQFDGDAYEMSEPPKVMTYDKEKGECTAVEPDYSVVHDNDELYEITMRDGRKIKTTGEHPFLVLEDDGTYRYKESQNLSDNDTVVVSRDIDLRTGTSGHKLVVESLVDNEDLSIYRNGHRVDLSNALDDSNYEDLYESITITSERSSKEVNLPEPSELYYLAGLMVADGEANTGKLVSGSERVIDAVENIADGNIPSYFKSKVPNKNAYRLSLGGSIFSRILELVFDLPSTNKSASVSISDTVFKSEESLKSQFIKGYMDGDGGYEMRRSAISAHSESSLMLKQLQQLLTHFGIHSNINWNRNDIYISGRNSLRNYRDNIGFIVEKRSKMLEELLDGSISSDMDKIPVDGEILRDVRNATNLSQMDISTGYDTYENNYVSLTKYALRKFIDVFESTHKDLGFEMYKLRRLARKDVSYIDVESVERHEGDYEVYDFGIKKTQNFVANGLVVHNTTLSDSLLKHAGLMSEEAAGERLGMDTEEDEQERGITIDAANISMRHEYEGDNYLVNLIDTPGHVDFGGDVTRAMRAVDGVVILVDAVEGVMPQTETVVRQALSENVKPVLFVNKVDRLIGELQEGPSEMQSRLQSVIQEVNQLITDIRGDDAEEDWTVSVADGTVGFGSALYTWGMSQPMMAETGHDFSDVMEWEQNEEREHLAQELPIEDVVLDMVVNHLPNPDIAQSRRVPAIWRGDEESEVGQSMKDVDTDASAVFMVTDIGVDEHSGEIATGRVFSGELEDGMEVYVSETAGTHTVNGVGVIMGDERVPVDSVPAGNIAAVTGLDKAVAGSTVSQEEITPFETVDHISEPVITKSIEPKSMSDLPDLIKVLMQVSKEDPTVRVQTDEETGENLISGQGELHLEVIADRITENHGLDVHTGDPIVIYREQPQENSDEVEGVSPNRHNKFYISVEPLPQDVVDGVKSGTIDMNMPETERREALQDAGIDKETSQNVDTMINTNLIIDDTKGIQHLNETMELVVEGCEEALENGPLAEEPVEGAMVRLHDAKLHEDAIHRGPAQVIPAVRGALHSALIDARIKMLEPMQDVRIDVPDEHMGDASSAINSRRGEIHDMYQESGQMVVEGTAPVGEMLGFSSSIRSQTGGRASWNTENAGFELMADNLQRNKILEIRDRKGLKDELPSSVNYF